MSAFSSSDFRNSNLEKSICPLAFLEIEISRYSGICENAFCPLTISVNKISMVVFIIYLTSLSVGYFVQKHGCQRLCLRSGGFTKPPLSAWENIVV